jgi:hypothetical protein
LVGLVDLFYLSYSFSHSSRARKTHQTRKKPGTDKSDHLKLQRHG